MKANERFIWAIVATIIISSIISLVTLYIYPEIDTFHLAGSIFLLGSIAFFFVIFKLQPKIIQMQINQDMGLYVLTNRGEVWAAQNLDGNGPKWRKIVEHSDLEES